MIDALTIALVDRVRRPGNDRLRPVATGVRFVLPCICALAMSVPASAQRVTGRVLDAQTREPITFAIVALVDGGGTVVHQVLTSDAGLFSLQPRSRGAFHLRIERIGYATVEEPPFRIDDANDRHFEILVSPSAVSLTGIAVTGERVCAMHASAADVVRVWAEARKSLAAAVVAERERIFTVSGSSYRRYIATDGLVTNLTHQSLLAWNRHMYRSVPAEFLAEFGYVDASDDVQTFFAPDAPVLLSPEFEQTHCFSLVRDRAAPEWIGVRFTPNAQQTVPDIAGTAWLDQATSLLQLVEFRYVNARDVPYADSAGGRVEFHRLPNGGMVVGRWWVRMAGTVREITRSRATITHWWEDRGEVRRVRSGDREWIVVPDGVIEGIAHDSTAGGVAAGATIHVNGTEIAVVSDSLGRFRITDLPDGRYTITLTRPRLDTLPAYPASLLSRVVSVAPGDTTRVDVAVPPLSRSELARCRGRRDLNRVHVYGTVLDAASGTPVPHARFVVSWDSIYSERGRLGSRTRGIEVTAGEYGNYVICGLQRSMPVTVRHNIDGRLTDPADFHTGDATAEFDGTRIMYQPLMRSRNPVRNEERSDAVLRQR